MSISIIMVIALLLIVGSIIAVYNGLIALIEAINNNKRQIDIQLDRRYKVLESLVEVLKKYMNYEQSTLKDVVALRNQAQAAKVSGDEHARAEAENGISKITSQLNVVFEQYPELKANENALQLQEEVVNTENQLAYAKQAYNDSIERYNVQKKSFLQSMVVQLFAAKLNQDFEYWGLAQQDVQSKEDYKVKF